MDVSFIILTWNSERYVEACLSHIKAALASTSMRYEIRILDNGSRDSTPALLRRLAAEDPDRIVPRFEPENLGTSGSRNILSAAATGTYLCVMDSDVELRPGVLEGLLRALESDRERIGIVAPKIVYPDGRWQKSIDRFPTLFDKIHRFLRLRQIEAREGLDAESWDEPRYVDYAISAFWLVRRDIWNEVGQLDERIFYAPEDVDFCLRVWRHGYRILYVPTVSVVHHTQEISRGLILNRAKLNHVKGLLYYFMKHRYVLRRPRFQVGEIH